MPSEKSEKRLPRATKSSGGGGDGERVNGIGEVSEPARIEGIGEGRSSRLLVVVFPEEVRGAQDPECEPSANVVQGTKLEQSRCIHSRPHRERGPRISQGPRARCFVPTRNLLPKTLESPLLTCRYLRCMLKWKSYHAVVVIIVVIVSLVFCSYKELTKTSVDVSIFKIYTHFSIIS